MDFEELKTAMVNASVLALPIFQEEFIVVTDVSAEGIGAVMQQDGHPIAYLSRSLAPRPKGLSTYEKKLWAMVYDLEKWRGYLLDRHFKIKIDHFSLKYLMEQILTTPFQIKWLPKLLGWATDSQFANDQLRRNGKLVIRPGVNLRQELLKYYHDEPMGFHYVEANYKRLELFFIGRV
ncbi:putative mitochondrial protein [Tanacetum coccineum]